MPSWRRVKNDKVEVVVVKGFHDFSETGGLVDTWDGAHQFLEEAIADS